uniref:Uncharacterized protein n=1 Tax=Oryzias latipes TaxID=8090 RepID=A0A3B3HPT2_ORYLA
SSSQFVSDVLGQVLHSTTPGPGTEEPRWHTGFCVPRSTARLWLQRSHSGRIKESQCPRRFGKNNDFVLPLTSIISPYTQHSTMLALGWTGIPKTPSSRYRRPALSVFKCLTNPRH